MGPLVFLENVLLLIDRGRRARKGVEHGKRSQGSDALENVLGGLSPPLLVLREFWGKTCLDRVVLIVLFQHVGMSNYLCKCLASVQSPRICLWEASQPGQNIRAKICSVISLFLSQLR